MLFSLLSRWRVSYRPTEFTAFLPWLCAPKRRVLTCSPRLCFISAFPWGPCGSRGACPARLGLKPSCLPSPLRPCPRPPSCPSAGAAARSPSASRPQDAAAASRAPRRATNLGRGRCAPSEHGACAAPPLAPPPTPPLRVCAARGRAAGRTSAPVGAAGPQRPKHARLCPLTWLLRARQLLSEPSTGLRRAYGSGQDGFETIPVFSRDPDKLCARGRVPALLRKAPSGLHARRDLSSPPAHRPCVAPGQQAQQLPEVSLPQSAPGKTGPTAPLASAPVRRAPLCRARF